MRKQFLPIFFLLALISGAISSARAAVTETQPLVHAAPPLAAAPAQPGKPAWLTPEKEAVLVEVRKILREARQVAESFELPGKFTTNPTLLTGLERRKSQLLADIENAQIRAGDFTAATNAKRLELFALAQARFEYTKEAVQTASRNREADDELLALLDALIKSGDVLAAFAVLEASEAKEGVLSRRDRRRAVGLSLIARRLYESGDVDTARVVLQKAEKSIPDKNYLEDYFLTLLHIARTQAALEDRVKSKESFRQALEAALARRELADKVEALRVIAKAQAESGDKSASNQTFREAIQLISSAPPPRIFNLGCIAWSQVVTGNKEAGNQTLKQAIGNAEEVQVAKRGSVLSELGSWQVKAGDYQGARETVQLMLRRGESLADAEAKSNAIASAAALAVRAGEIKQAIELASQVSDDWERAGVLAAITQTLIRTRDPLGTPEVFLQLAERASAILKNPPPKEQSKSDNMRSSIVRVQIVAGDVSVALRTANTISLLSTQIRSYGKSANLLTAKGDFAGAMQVIQAMKDEWLAFSESEDAGRKLARAQSRIGDPIAATAWARQQKSVYARSQGLLGVALGLMEKHSVEDTERVVPEIPMRDQCPMLIESPL